MTKNEYQAFLKECANKLYTEPGYTMERFNADVDNAVVEPFDLSRFPALSETSIKWVNIFFDEEDVDRNGDCLLRGFTRREMQAVDLLNCSYGDYANAYSFFAYNGEEYFIFTYCEGDITLTLYPDKESYQKGYDETYAWYKEARA